MFLLIGLFFSDFVELVLASSFIYLLYLFRIYRTHYAFIYSTLYISFTKPASVSISFNVSLINIYD